MTSKFSNSVKKLIADSISLKNKALNRDHSGFVTWHGQARDTVREIVPIKLKVFDEIPFASDFFLSKPLKERQQINDRIALVSDFELMEKLLKTVLDISLKQDTLKQPEPDGDSSEFFQNLQELWGPELKSLRDLEWSTRELSEIQDELKSLESELTKSEPNWDRLKRGIKFFLEYDRSLALDIVPVILSIYQKQLSQ